MAYNRINHSFLIKGYLLDNTTSESFDISSNIVEVLIKKAYIDQAFPLFTINLRTTEEMRDRMRDNEVSVNLRISYLNAEDVDETDNVDTNEHTEVGVYYEGTIRIYDKPFTTSVSKVEEDSDSESSQVESAPFVNYTLAGIPENLIVKNENCFNNVYKDCSTGDVVVNLLSSLGDKNVYIEEPDNKTEYKNILIPPLNIVPAISFLDSNYYIYSKGANIFFDADRTYVYSPLSKNHESNIIECQVINTEITTNSDTMLFPRVNENNDIKINFKTVPAYKTKKYIAEHNLGNHAVLYYFDENLNLVYQNEESDKGYNKVRYIWNPLYNKTINNLRTNESIALSFSNMNPGLLNPLSTVRLISDKYKAAEGDYAISDIRIGFTTGDNRVYNDSIAVGLIKK